MLRMLVVAIVTAALCATSTGCSGRDPFNPGTKLGTFRVTAKLTRSTCGPTPDPWAFDVRLAHDGPTLYWIQGGAPVQGSIDANAKALLETETLHEVRAADPKRKKAACSIARSDALAITLVGSDGNPVTNPALTSSLSGSLVYAFAPTEGSDCSDQLTASGGGFATLPCEVAYEVTGALERAPE
jgi:hypothetical protein